MSVIVEAKQIECRIQNHTVIDNLSLHINDGAVACLLGPSGCGKTTLLRAIAGFESIHKGSISLRKQVIAKPGYALPPERRGLAMVFQDYALFPHLTINTNICFGIRQKDNTTQKRIANDLLDMMELAGLGHRYPHELSGGQQQRVALARALAPKPDILLMDEPFSNLDVDLRERLRQNVRDRLKEHNTTAILVTHDQQEAFSISDVMGVMYQGKILQWDTPFNLYHEPCNRFVADFIGPGVFLPGRLLQPHAVETELGVIKGDRAYQWPAGSPVEVLLRPDDVMVKPESPLRATVLKKAFKGAQILYTLRLSKGSTLLSFFPSHFNYQIGEDVGIRLAAEHLIIFPTEPTDAEVNYNAAG